MVSSGNKFNKSKPEKINLIEIEKHIVPEKIDKIRLYDYCPGIFEMINSRSALKKIIKKGFITINGTPGLSGTYLKGGEELVLLKPIEESTKPQINLKLNVVFEDDYLAIINKPAGIEVSGNKHWTVENALNANLNMSTQSDYLTYPQAIHRLDYATSGLLLVGKTSGAVFKLNKLFSSREIQKHYHAVTIGEMVKEGIIDSKIDDKQALTQFKVIKTVKSIKYGYLNLVKIALKTGRRHQIRKHMLELGNPVFGDKVYFKEGLVHKGRGLYLHASNIQFRHPFTNDWIDMCSALPKKINSIFL